MKRSEGVRADRSRLVHCSFAEEALVEAEGGRDSRKGVQHPAAAHARQHKASNIRRGPRPAGTFDSSPLRSGGKRR
jgi:hypothetical protein